MKEVRQVRKSTYGEREKIKITDLEENEIAILSQMLNIRVKRGNKDSYFLLFFPNYQMKKYAISYNSWQPRKPF